jgi:O-acetylhomoserine/O-acetylserine sulfhydrylase-like pyridoxal-dependent enzyme
VRDDTPTPTGAFATRQVHAGTAPDPVSGSRAQPIHATSSYVFDDAAHAQALFAGAAEGNQYGRMHNPTSAAFAARIADLEGGAAAVPLASGQAASAATLLALARPGAKVVCSTDVFGGTASLFRKWLTPWGVELVSVRPDAAAIGDALDERTVACWVETIGNPSGSVPDLSALAERCADAGVPLVVDNTWGCGGYLCRPIEHGAAAVVHSATKWIGGHGTFVGGVVVDAGTFDWSRGPVPALRDAAGPAPLATRVHDLGLFTLGATLSPFAAFLGLQGLETLDLRVQRSCDTALALARWLDDRGDVGRVLYPGLPHHPSHATARRVLRHGFGAVLAFELADQDAAHAFLDRLRLVSHLANIGDAKSVAIHPWTTTHASMPEGERRAAGVTPGLVRLSLGLEDASDLRRDLEQALAGA